MLQKVRREGEERDAQQKASEAGLGYFNLTTNPVQVEALKLISEEKARRFRIAPFQLKGKNLAIAVADPTNAQVKKVFKDFENEGYLIKIFVSSPSSLEQVWVNYKFIPKKTESITGKVAIEKGRFSELYKRLTDLDKI